MGISRERTQSERPALTGTSCLSRLKSLPDSIAITFDVGGTLIEPYPSVGEVYACVAKRFGIAADPKTLNENFARAWKLKGVFNHSRRAWFDLVAVSFQNFGRISPECFNAIYREFAQSAAWRIYPDTVACLESLKRARIRLGIISNWDERIRPLLEALKLSGYFEQIIISQEVGCPKPGPGIFHAAAQAFQLHASSILHIGDGRAEDFEGARAAGFKALLLDRSHDSSSGSIRTLAGLSRGVK